MVASAPIMRVRARNPNKKIASLAMKSPTQSVRYRVRRAGATPSGRARSSGRGWKIVRLQAVSVQTQLRQINTDQMRGVPRSPSYFSTGPTLSTQDISRRSRLAGEGAVSPDIYVSDRPRSPASRFLQICVRAPYGGANRTLLGFCNSFLQADTMLSVRTMTLDDYDAVVGLMRATPDI
jgi:hypothetical protein